MSPQTSYQQGVALERRVRLFLIDAGFVVMRSAGSKGAVDLMAVRPGELLFVQVKRGAPPGPAAWNLLVDMADWCGAVPLLASVAPYARNIRWDKIVLRKPIHRRAKSGQGAASPTGTCPYVITRTAVVETEGESDGTEDAAGSADRASGPAWNW